MSRYLYNAAYYWEVVVDSRSPEAGFPIYLEERSTGRRRFLRSFVNRREFEAFCRDLQKDLYLTEEEFEQKYGVELSPHHAPEAPKKDDFPQAA